MCKVIAYILPIVASVIWIEVLKLKLRPGDLSVSLLVLNSGVVPIYLALVGSMFIKNHSKKKFF